MLRARPEPKDQPAFSQGLNKKIMAGNIRLISLLTIVFISLATPSSAQKNDTIFHTNGNVLTGEFRKLNYGVLTWKMQGMGTISLELPEIQNIISRKQYEVKLKDGMIYFGSFDTTATEKKVKLILTNGSELLSINDIVEIYPIKKSFWLRTTGKFSLGLNYSKGSDVATLVFAGDLVYRKRKSFVEIKWDNNNTFQSDTLSATNINLSLGFQRALRNYWSIGTAIGASQNSQLGVKLRLYLDAIGIRDIVYNSWNRLFVGAGLSVQRETPYDNLDESNDLAGIITTVWKVYKYTDPKIWVDSDLSFFPYITGESRYRVKFDLNPRVGIIGNTLQVGFAFYYNYDSRPPSNATSTYDWGINFHLTYSLH